MGFAFIFPGQGSQSSGMLKELAAAFPMVKETFAEASDTLELDLWHLTQDAPADELNRTENTQPVMLTAGIAAARVWEDQGGPRASICAGHSLGEYTALVYAGALTFRDALKLVRLRGRCMQAAVPPSEGAMAAVLGLDDARVEELCRKAAQGDVLSPANFNSPGQVVVAGQSAAVERLIEAAKEAGAKRALKLQVSVPSHCELMEPAEASLRGSLREITVKLPEPLVIHNVDARSRGSVEDIRQALSEQLHQPVRWVQCVQTIAAQDINTFIECGPGKVLLGLNKRIDKNLKTFAVFDPKSLEQSLEAMESA